MQKVEQSLSDKIYLTDLLFFLYSLLRVAPKTITKIGI